MTILAELTDDGAGRLSYRGARFLLIRPETLAALHHALETALGASAADCLVAGGRAGGGKATASLGHGGPTTSDPQTPSGHGGPTTSDPQTPSSEAGRERVEALLAMGTRIGWGRFALERYAPDELVVTVSGSPFAEAYGPAPAAVCHLTRGVLEALASVVLSGRPHVIETACAAAGAGVCRFEARV